MKSKILMLLLTLALTTSAYFVGTKTTTTATTDFQKDFINMNEVADFSVKGNQLTIYTTSGDYYLWER